MYNTVTTVLGSVHLYLVTNKFCDQPNKFFTYINSFRNMYKLCYWLLRIKFKFYDVGFFIFQN
jgi:hypothetical protein